MIDLVIMAGGEGRRLQPLTNIVPKPLLTVGSDQTILEKIILFFSKKVTGKIYILAKYKINLIRAFLDIQKFKNVVLVEEPEFMGTVGGIRLISDKLSDNFFVSNCDILVDIDLDLLVSQHVNKYDLSAVAFQKNVELPYGIFQFDPEGSMVNFLEKPTVCLYANAGVYMMSKNIFSYFSTDKLGMDELIFNVLAQKKEINIYPISEECFHDIGQLPEYKKTLEGLC